jgi:hypothetical protein
MAQDWYEVAEDALRRAESAVKLTEVNADERK